MILHRPGDEMTRLTPTNKTIRRRPLATPGQAEHDEFAHTLSSRGAEVLYLTELLAETLAVPEARTHVLDAVLAPLLRQGHSRCCTPGRPASRTPTWRGA